MKEQASQYYSLIGIAMSVLDPSITEVNAGMVVKRFPVKEAKTLKISNYVKTFGFFNPVLGKYIVCEQLSGLTIGTGLTEEAAIEDVKRFFRECNERMFFVQMHAFGPSNKRPLITWDEAMQHYEAGNTERKAKQAPSSTNPANN